MLMLTTTGFNREDNKVSLFPVISDSIHNGISLALQDKEANASLVPVFSRMTEDTLNEDEPIWSGELIPV